MLSHQHLVNLSHKNKMLDAESAVELGSSAQQKSRALSPEAVRQCLNQYQKSQPAFTLSVFAHPFIRKLNQWLALANQTDNSAAHWPQLFELVRQFHAKHGVSLDRGVADCYQQPLHRCFLHLSWILENLGFNGHSLRPAQFNDIGVLEEDFADVAFAKILVMNGEVFNLDEITNAFIRKQAVVHPGSEKPFKAKEISFLIQHSAELRRQITDTFHFEANLLKQRPVLNPAVIQRIIKLGKQIKANKGRKFNLHRATQTLYSFSQFMEQYPEDTMILENLSYHLPRRNQHVSFKQLFTETSDQLCAESLHKDVAQWIEKFKQHYHHKTLQQAVLETPDFASNDLTDESQLHNYMHIIQQQQPRP